MATGILTFMESIYANEVTSERLNQRIEKTLIMKAALDNSVTSAGSIAAPTLSVSNTANQNGSTPFNFLGAIGRFLYGNCPNQGIFGNIYGFLNNTTNTFLDDIFLGGYNAQHTTATGGNLNLSSVTIPAEPLTVTASTISVYWLAVHANGGDELCAGQITLNGSNIMDYQITGSANNGYSNCGTPGRSNAVQTDFPVGTGWKFSGPIPDADCLGSRTVPNPAYPNTTPEAVVATDSSANGLNSTGVTVCLPAM
jgi:hypothetical protein